ncbi:zinc finger translocation-associated protein isoform X2 [Dendropsophus ebraccatus]|uniref:zinc finger translocation-associated protein isoform X2 n=1 Tax=Dendropsophus ebraccatus TaxID=150705 RepID=UPI003831275D
MYPPLSPVRRALALPLPWRQAIAPPSCAVLCGVYLGPSVSLPCALGAEERGAAQQAERRTRGGEDMQRDTMSEEEPEVAIGPKTGPAGGSPCKSGDLALDSAVMEIKEEAAGESVKGKTGPKKKRRRLPPVTKGAWRPMLGSEHPLPSPPDKTHLEQYMNESLQQWFRIEFLMDYDYLGNMLHCMMCTTALPSLCLTDIKYHILDNHPTSLQFTPSQKSVIIDAWINRKGTPEVELEGDLTPDVEVEDDMTPDVEMEDDDTTPEVELEEDLTPDVEDDDDGDEADGKSAKINEQITQSSTKPRSENRMLEPTDLEIVEDEEPASGDVQLLDKEEWDAKEVQLLAEDEWKARKRHLLESGRKARELRIVEEHQKSEDEEKPGDKESQFTEEEKRKIRERQLLEEEQKLRQMLSEEKAREAVLIKARKPQVVEEANRKDIEAPQLEEEKGKAELLDEEKRKAKEEAKKAQLSDEKNPKETQVKEEDISEEEKLKTWEAQLLGDERVKEAKRLEQEKPKDQNEKGQEGQGLSKEVQDAEEVIVKLEDLESAEVTNSEQQDTQTANHSQVEKQQIYKKMVEGGKTQPSEPEKRVIQVQQAPAVLGIGLPVLKMETPTPIIITRVSVIPEHTILQSAKPKPSTSTSTSDISKTWRVIAPKVSPADNQNLNPPSASTDPSQNPAGVDHNVWEVSVSRGNNASAIQNNMYQTRWRSEYLMDFNGVRGSVVCMYCSSTLTVLKESSIKRHITQKHPHTANFSAKEKAAVLLDWENKLIKIKKIVANPNKDGLAIGDLGLNIVKAPDCDPVEPEEEETNWAGVLPENKGASWEFAFGRLQDKVKDPRKYQHDRWKLEFLMDYTPAKDGLICMVCGATLINPKISTVKMHIQQKHPDTTYLSDQEKAVVMEEWEQKMATGKKSAGQQHGEDEICIEINEDSTTSETNGSSVAASSPHPTIVLPTFPKTPKSTVSLPPPCNSAKRNYQVRWRTEFMMDYDCRRQGLICMVCGGTLATLKVSTIKRHIVQVHPYSVDFTAEERQRILEAYSEMALHYIHSEECFKTQPQEEAKGRKRKSTAMDES